MLSDEVNHMVNWKLDCKVQCSNLTQSIICECYIPEVDLCKTIFLKNHITYFDIKGREDEWNHCFRLHFPDKQPLTIEDYCHIVYGVIMVWKSLMAEWLEQASQWYGMYCHDLEVMSSNRSTSVLCHTWTKNTIRQLIEYWILHSLPWKAIPFMFFYVSLVFSCSPAPLTLFLFVLLHIHFSPCFFFNVLSCPTNALFPAEHNLNANYIFHYLLLKLDKTFCTYN